MAVAEFPSFLDHFTPSPLRRRQDTDAMADSIARLTAEQGISLAYVAAEWGKQKGIGFVNKLLETTIYRGLAEKDKDQIRSSAIHAIRQDIIKRVGR